MLDLNLNLDVPTLPSGRSGIRHLVARVTPPAPDPNREPTPLDLALVIDASGSMGGGPLEAAKRAVLDIARELPTTAMLTVVSFADDVVVHADGVRLDDLERESFTSRIAAIRTRGCTNLHAGWQTACTLLESAAVPGRRRQVVVLSDGMANRGVTDPHALASEARSSLSRGIATSCVGVGDHYEQRQLAALADHGGGETHHAENAPEIVEILLGEVLSLESICAENVELVFDLPAGVHAEELSGDLATSVDGRQVTVLLGALRAGRQRTVALRLEIHPLEAMLFDVREYEFGARLRHGRGEAHEDLAAAARATLETSHERAPAPPLSLSRLVLEAWQSRLVRRATDLNRAMDFEGLERLWRGEYDAFVTYASFHDETIDFVETLAAVKRRTSRPMQERTRKVGQDMARKLARTAQAHYVQEKGTVRTLFEESRGGPGE